ncbi:O-methyltransferase [Nocardia terpenica]|uniref:Methyltransferase domain-containing protein n=1 Tax=Nocardia terpenica TaxID=455432 RepID=A0A6G9Z2N2_9NOCA|nr:O-methyltransferase [Nocardia terpenica]QIS19778.1 methyltransferase domain-containing protein [Nocardia terpenica]
MTKADWSDVDRYLVDTLIGHGDEDVQQANSAAGLPAIDVSPPQGKFLHLIARSLQAGRALEIGTLGGYSALWLARAVGPQGRVVTLEFDPERAKVARENLDRKGVGDRVDIRVGAALDTLPVLTKEDPEPFDLVFIDADKANNTEYVRWALRLTRPGSVIVVDNVVRRGGLVDGDPDDASVRGSREVIEFVAAEPRLDGTVLQTVGAKGWDGFVYALVVD